MNDIDDIRCDSCSCFNVGCTDCEIHLIENWKRLTTDIKSAFVVGYEYGRMDESDNYPPRGLGAYNEWRQMKPVSSQKS